MGDLLDLSSLLPMTYTVPLSILDNCVQGYETQGGTCNTGPGTNGGTCDIGLSGCTGEECRDGLTTYGTACNAGWDTS